MSSLPSSSLLLKLPTVKITNMISDYLLECVCASLNTNKKKGAVGRSYRAKKNYKSISVIWNEWFLFLGKGPRHVILQ